jgi:hypothetical protein
MLWPAKKFTFDVPVGRASPQGYAVRNPAALDPVTVMFADTATASAGIGFLPAMATVRMSADVNRSAADARESYMRVGRTVFIAGPRTVIPRHPMSRCGSKPDAGGESVSVSNTQTRCGPGSRGRRAENVSSAVAGGVVADVDEVDNVVDGVDGVVDEEGVDEEGVVEEGVDEEGVDDFGVG